MMRRAVGNREYANILVVRFSSMGDIVLTTPVLDALRSRFPSARIAYLLKEQFAPLLMNHRSDCKTIGLPEDIRADSQKFVDFAQTLAKQKFDLVVDLQGNARSFVVRRKIDAEFTKVKKHTIRRIAIIRFKTGARRLPNVRDRFFRTLEPLGIPMDSRGRPSLDPTDEEIRDVTEKFFGGKIARPLALIHPEAKWPLKEWGLSKFGVLCNMLIDKGFNIACFARAFDKTIALNDTTIRELMALIALADVFIGNDSGPLHIAEALGIPSLGIFGPTHEMLGYASDCPINATIGLDLKCRPCSLYGNGTCKTGNRECMKNLSAEAVFGKALEIYQMGKDKGGKPDER